MRHSNRSTRVMALALIALVLGAAGCTAGEGEQPHGAADEVPQTGGSSEDASQETLDVLNDALAGPGGESVITRNGVDEGTFTVNDDRVTIHEHNMGSVMALSAAGMEMVIPPEPVDYSEARYMCSASEASISTPDGTVLLSRVSD